MAELCSSGITSMFKVGRHGLVVIKARNVVQMHTELRYLWYPEKILGVEDV